MSVVQVYILWLIVIGLGYILPAVIAVWRGHPLRWPIAVANVLLGWTLVGYVICFCLQFGQEIRLSASGNGHLP